MDIFWYAENQKHSIKHENHTPGTTYVKGQDIKESHSGSFDKSVQVPEH